MWQIPAVKSKCYRTFPVLCALVAFSTATGGEPGIECKSGRLLLKAAMQGGADSEKTAALLEAGLTCELAGRFGRLLPKGATMAEKRALGSSLLDSEWTEAIRTRIEGYPRFDELVFHGRQYSGGNSGHIESIIGESGLPIAADRLAPMILVPLQAQTERELLEERTKFVESEQNKAARQAAEAQYGLGAGDLMFGDGQFLRPYLGRVDDLYYHLFQNGNAASAMAFHSIVEGFSTRRYTALRGLSLRRPEPELTLVDWDDIISGGAKGAVKAHLQLRAVDAEPFQGFAHRMLPMLLSRAAQLSTGSRMVASNEDIVRVSRSPRRLYPAQVPPLYRSAQRFLGYEGAMIIPAANRRAQAAPIPESWYPLPGHPAHEEREFAAEHSSSEQLFEMSESAAATPIEAVRSSTADEIVWEDPQESTLLADALKAEENASKAPSASVLASTPAGANAADKRNDPRLKATQSRLVAVVTPTTQELEDYRSAISSNDSEIRSASRLCGRLSTMREALLAAQQSLGGGNGKSPNRSPEIVLALESLEADLISLAFRDSEFAGSLNTLLHERASIRSALVDQITTSRVQPLRKRNAQAVQADTSI